MGFLGSSCTQIFATPVEYVDEWLKIVENLLLYVAINTTNRVQALTTTQALRKVTKLCQSELTNHTSVTVPECMVFVPGLLPGLAGLL